MTSYLDRAKRLSRDVRITVTPFDRLCWEYSKAGQDPQYIATMMNSNPEEVQEAITAVERWKAGNSLEIVTAAMNEQALIAIEPVGRTLAEAQSAQRMVAPAIVDQKTGEILREAQYVPDYGTRIAATEAVARVVESVKERGPGVQVNVGGQHLHAGGGRSFEERLRLQREKRGMRESDMSESVTIDGNVATVMRDGSAEEDIEEGFDDELEDEDEGDFDTEDVEE